MGVLYRAQDTRLGRYVAIKFASDEFCNKALVRDCFHREACAASSLNHPNICAVYDVGEFDGRSFIVMELLEGKTLSGLIRGPLKIESCLDIGSQISDGLDCIHSAGIVHRDIKPSNIFITTRGQAKLLDFGVAIRVHEPAGANHGKRADALSLDSLADAAVALGTPAYMSPEQAGGKGVDQRTDLFSLGVVLYEMLTGERPFQATPTADVINTVVSRPFVPLSRLRPELPDKLEYIITKMLEKDRELRSQTANELRVDFERLQRDLRLERTRYAGRNSGLIASVTSA